MFIAIEGGEGCGKSTQARLLSEWMDAQGIEHVLAREPGGTKTGEAVRELVLSGLDMDRLTELFMILASRSEFVTRIARPTLESGMALIADRFSLSTLAYQGYGRGIDLGVVRAGLEIATGGLEPDLYVVIDLPREVARSRMERAGGGRDRIERAGEEFMAAVSDGYRRLVRSAPHVAMVDGSGTEAEVHDAVRRLVDERLRGGTRDPRAPGRPSNGYTPSRKGGRF